MDSQAILFWILAIVTGFSAVAVVLTQNIVRAATWLLFTLAGVSGIFFLLGADFVGATQLLVYVGGTLVLVVFGVMLTAQGPFINMKTGAAEWAIAAVAGILFFGMLAASLMKLVPGQEPAPGMTDPAYSTSSVDLGEAMLGIEHATPPHYITGAPVGVERVRQRVSYLLPFEIVSVHLLVVLLGAAYLARAKRRRGVVA